MNFYDSDKRFIGDKMPFENITAEHHAAFLSSLKAGQYNLLLGAGVSMDSSNARGNLPSGSALSLTLSHFITLHYMSFAIDIHLIT